MIKTLGALCLLLVAGATPAQAPAPADAPTPPAPAGPSAPLSLRPVSSPKPRLSDEVCQRRLSGWVSLEFAVLPDGTVAEVHVHASEPKGAFDSAAVEAVAGRTYPPLAKPVKLRERLPMSFSDCRAEQLRPVTAATLDGIAPSQEDCAGIAAEARTAGEAIAPAESARAVLTGDGAQVYTAPSTHCFVTGRKLKPGSRLLARVEYKTFSLVATPKGNDEFWVWSNQLKDVAP